MSSLSSAEKPLVQNVSLDGVAGAKTKAKSPRRKRIAETRHNALRHAGSHLINPTLPPPVEDDEDKAWKRLLHESIETPEEVSEKWGEDVETMRALEKEFNIRINPYYASLIQEKDDPIYKQVVPSKYELIKGCCVDDPLNEERDSPVPSITHRYPDRVLFLVAHECAVYCRFCTRKRKVSDSSKISLKHLEAGINYIREHKEVRDVVLSGGDPLTLSDRRIEYILKSLREIPHVEIIRIGTKIPCVLPQRVTKKLVNIIKKYHPVYVNTHFNHPRELTPEAKQACERLADAGVPVGNQCVLLKGVNDDVETMRALMKGLLKMRVRPYYIYQADIVKGTEHFRTRVEKGLEIIQGLRGHISGLAIPHFVIDSPGGGGKIPLLPHYIEKMDDKEVVMRNFKGERYVYPQVQENIEPTLKTLEEIAKANGFQLGAEIQDYF
ncbi:MAG: KamA family radical SAM protein [Chloroherpetonaceae bacterium]|nr:KamA family radical SAM protein [Chloroherpetonaceae bacterium]MDW8438287.1 KamA family radical SAM protein [Chloroherpetonaceae bacterium]